MSSRKKKNLKSHLERLTHRCHRISTYFRHFDSDSLKTTFVAGKSTHKHTAAHPVPVTDLLCNLNVNVESVLCGSTVDVPGHGRTTNPE